MQCQVVAVGVTKVDARTALDQVGVGKPSSQADA